MPKMSIGFSKVFIFVRRKRWISVPTGRKVTYRPALLGWALLYGLITGCAATLPELKGPLDPGEELVTLGTRPGVTVRLLLITPKTVPKGIFLFFPGGEGYLVNTEEGRPKRLFIREFREEGFMAAIVDVPSDQPYGMLGGDRFRTSKEHL